MLPSLRFGLVLAVSTFAGAASANAQSLIQNFNFTRSGGADSITSPTAVSAGTGYSWSVSLTDMVANGVVFGSSIPLPLASYGVNPTALNASGTTGPIPGNLLTRTFSYIDVGASGPAYNFTVSVDLLADLTVKTSVNVISLGTFTAFGITGSPVPIPVTSVTVGGMAQVTPLIPAPAGSVALVGAGLALVMRRRR